MGSLSPEVSFEHRPAWVARSIGGLLRDISSVSDAAERSSKLTELVGMLEDEMRKIDAFKRELPLCMILLRDAVDSLKLQSMQRSISPTVEPVTAEFIPLTKDHDLTKDESAQEKEQDTKDENLGSLDLQLCTLDGSNFSTVHSLESHPDVKAETKRHELLVNQPTTGDLLKKSRSRNTGREFMPLREFSSPPATIFPSKEDKVELPYLHSISLLTPGMENPREKPISIDRTTNFGRSSLAQTVQPNSRSGPPHQSLKKQRRCWSPELHRLFISALERLGGSQAATPKQIRELMQVDGLTNDEVKSHLQKYRMHRRRSPITVALPTNQQVRVLSSTLWPSGEQSDDAIASKGGSSSQSGSPQGPLQLRGNAGATSTTGGDSMEDGDEDSKSESYSWKSHFQGTGKVEV
ncbi:hypothetical protein SAY86_019582 [Trapa natans]|uniref:HTH myb-type domain-containing protein n=1 Tax=Trapa natans TaxID=22666 RepID=A0AAN7LHK3_TRANT|nr:hypothetical protein SAY86_019582 [Trapa natans]